MVIITSIDDPRISFYRSLRYTPRLHLENRVFIAEGKKLVLRLLNSKLKIHSIFAVKEFIQNYFEIISNRLEYPNLQIYTADLTLMEQIVGFHLHSGVMAIAYQPKDTPLEKMSKIIIALNCINNSDNVGLIVRTMRAFGIDSLLVDEHSTSPFLRRAVRVSMGNVFDIKVNHSQSFKDSISYLKTNGYKIISAEIIQNSIDLTNFSFPEKFVLIFGNEENGIEDWVIKESDFVVQIPICTSVDSINVAISSAIFFYEYSRQKK